MRRQAVEHPQDLVALFDPTDGYAGFFGHENGGWAVGDFYAIRAAFLFDGRLEGEGFGIVFPEYSTPFQETSRSEY